MNRSFAALAMGCALAFTSLAAVAGSTSPDMGPPPSQTGLDPRTQGNDIERQGTDMDKGDPATGIRRGMNTDPMNNGGAGSSKIVLPGDDSTGAGSVGNGSKGSSGGASTTGAAGS